MSKELNLDDLEQVQGGNKGHDDFNSYEYSQAGITWNHYDKKKDEYFITVGGVQVSISQKDAEKLVRDWRHNNPHSKQSYN